MNERIERILALLAPGLKLAMNSERAALLVAQHVAPLVVEEAIEKIRPFRLNQCLFIETQGGWKCCAAFPASQNLFGFGSTPAEAAEDYDYNFDPTAWPKHTCYPLRRKAPDK